MTALQWAGFQRPATWRQSGREHLGPCPLTGEGTTKAWAIPADDVLGCRACGDGSGKLTGAAFREHAAALGLLVDLGQNGAARNGASPLDVWIWSAADGRERKQFRWACNCGRDPNCAKCHGKGSYKRPQVKGGPWSGNAELLYLPTGVPAAPGPIYVCEGASDTDEVIALGLAAIGRFNARPDAASLARLNRDAAYRVWPDHDPDGYKQAFMWHAAMTKAELRCDVIDPLLLNPDAPDGFDARDWVRFLPTGTDAAGAAALLDKAVVPVEVIRARIPARQHDTPIIVPYSAAGLSDALDHLNIALRFNLRSKVEEIRRGVGRWERLTGGDRDVLRAELYEAIQFPARGQDSDNRPAKWAINELRSHVGALAHRQRVDPFLAWVQDLPPWDGSPRLDTWLSTVLPVADADPHYPAWCSRSVLLAAVQRAARPGLKHDHVVVLVGPQGALKSTVWRLLFPDADQAEWFSDGLDLREERKGMTEATQGRVIVEVSELVTRRADLERVKAWVRQVDDGAVRLSYRTDPEPSPRRFVIVATSNRDDCLPDDPTGNRAFSPVRVGMAASATVYPWMDANRDQLWAEAWARRSEPAWMQRQMETTAQARQADLFRARNLAAEQVIDHFMAVHDSGPLRMEQVIDSLPEGERAAWKRDPRELGRVLESLHWTKRRESVGGVRSTWWRPATLPPSATLTIGEYKKAGTEGKVVLPRDEGGRGWQGGSGAAPPDFPPGALDGRANGALPSSGRTVDAADQGPPPSEHPAENPERRPSPTFEELRAAATAAGADLVLDRAGRPIWWETDGRITVATETPAPPPGDPDPSGDECSRCGRPWSDAMGPGYCSRCDSGAEWDETDAERRLRRLPMEDLRMLDGMLAAQDGRDADLAVIHDELARRGGD